MVNKVSHSFYVPIVLGCFRATKPHRTVIAEKRLQGPPSLRYSVPLRKKLLSPGVEEQSNGSEARIPVFRG